MDQYSSTKFISTYLDAPIIRNERDRFLLTLLKTKNGEKPVAHSSTKRKIKQMLAVIGDDDIGALDPDLYPSFDREIIPVNREDEIGKAHRMGRGVFNQASDGARTWGSSSGLGVDFFGLEGLDPIAKQWYSKMRLFEVIIQSIATLRSSGNKGLCQCRSGNIFFLGDEFFGIVKLDNVGDWYVVSYTQMLMFKDMYYGRFNAVLAAWQIYRSQEMVESIKDCLSWFFKCLAVYGNEGYGIGKSIESLAKANLIRVSDPILGEGGSYDDQLEGVKEKERGRGKRSGFLADELDSILRRDRVLPESVELFGLQKLSGHPLIDPEVGGRSVREEAAKKINYKYSDVRRLRNNCCRLYLEGYIRKEKKWPPLVFEDDSKRGKLYQLYSLEERDINRNSYPISDWEHVRFGKHHDFEYYPNFTDLMDDKSISFYRDEAAATWDSKIKTRSHQRLLLEMLSRPDVSIREIVTRVRTGDIPFSWFIVSLYPKEREFKIAARMFAMMVFEMRAFFTATEANIADKVFPFLPQQTMTLSKQEIQELFHKITESPDDVDLERLFLEVDLTRWNLRWHPEVVDPVGRDLDDMFGLPGTFTAIHHFFERCMILVRVPTCEPEGINLPEPPESDLCFYNHEVGFEGIGQKPWTLLTYGMIDLGAGDLATRYYLIGAADNQIILMSIDCTGVADKRAHIRAIAAEAKRRIQEECLKVGQEAKPDECLESTSSVTYGKNVYIYGIEYFTSIKAHSRIFPHSSSDFPSLDGSMGSISGQCLSAAEQTKEPMHSFALWCFHAALYLYRITESVFVEASQLSVRFKDTMSDRVIYGLLILPSDLGGTQIAPVTSFLYKGGADPLSKSYASLRFYQGSSGLSRKFIHSLQTCAWLEEDPDLDQLLDDPYGLPLTRPTTAENAIYRASKMKVNGLSRNREIKELTSVKIDDYDKDLRELLKSCRPFNPVLLSDILGWSVVGAQDTISRMFTSTRTIQSLLQGDADLSVCAKILATGTGHFLNTVARIALSTQGESKIMSVYKDICLMRSRWGHKDGIEISGVTSYVPFDLPLIVADSPIHRKGFKAMALPPRSYDPFHERGPEDPYIGRATVEKRSEHGYRIVTSSAPERAVKRLADIATQPGVSISFKNLVSEVARSRADVNLNEVYPMIGSAVGGTISHRYASRLGLRSANGLGTLSFASTCYLVNDDADPISGGERDVPIMVQEQMVAEIGVLGMNRRQNPGPLYCTLATDTIDWHFLPEETIEVNEMKSLETPFLAGNKLATVPHIELLKTHGPHSTPFITALADTYSHGYSPIYAARRMVGRALEGAHSALAIADQGLGVLRFKIDLMEARGVGLRNLMDAASSEICLTAIESLFAKSRSELRWTPAPMITTLADSFSKSMVPTCLHPIFKADPFVIDIVRPTPLKYNFAGQSPSRRIRDYIASQALRLFRDPSSTVYTEREVVFSDDKDGISSRLAVRRFKAILLQGILSGQCPMETALNLLRVQIPKALRSEQSEDGRLNAFYRLCVMLSDWSQQANLLFLHAQLTSLYTGQRLWLCRVPANDLIREARSISRVHEVRQDVATQISAELYEWDLTGMSHDLRGSRSPFSGFDNQGHQMAQARIHFELTRLQGRCFGRESAAGYSYSPVVPLTRGKVCMVIGCGYGSGAALLLCQGALLVFGIDLWKDCDERSVIGEMRDPPAIAHTGTGNRFVRLQTDPRETGDIREPRTAHFINRHSREGTVFLIDVPLSSSSDVSRILATCSLLIGIPQVLIRVINTRDTLLEMVCVLANAGLGPRVIPVSHTIDMIEAWVMIEIPSVFTLSGTRLARGPDNEPRVACRGGVESLGGGTGDLLASLEGPYHGLSRPVLEDGVLSMSGAMSMSTGDLDHRFTYRQWTEIIHVLVIRDILESADPISAARDLLEKDMTQVQIEPHLIPVEITAALRYHVVKVVPRLTDMRD